MARRRLLLVRAMVLSGAAGTVALIGWRRAFATGHIPAQIGLVAVAGASVAVADILIKREAATSLSTSAALSHPLLLLAVALYELQIVLVTYVFVQRWNLSTVGLTQVIVYAVTIVFVGAFLFQERISAAQGVGLALAVVAAFLMGA